MILLSSFARLGHGGCPELAGHGNAPQLSSTRFCLGNSAFIHPCLSLFLLEVR